MNDSSTERSRFQLRFSLLTILFVMALVACGITIWQLWRDVGPLRAEVRELRDETGRLVVDDPTQLYAVQVRQPDEFTWRWRIWLPPARTYVIRSVGGEIPAKGFPSQGGTMSVSESGEMWIEYRIMKDPRSDTWRGKMSTKTGSVGSHEHAWVDWRGRSGSSEGVGRSTVYSAPDKPLILTRQRFGEANNSQDIPDPAPGFMIWLEPQ